MMYRTIGLLSIFVVMSLNGCALAPSTNSKIEFQAREPIVIAHRGASGYLPEHTLAAVALAYDQGADYIEQDLVVTKDDRLIVLHDIHLDTTTNVAELFPHRKRADGRYYVVDFQLAELRQLDVFERRDLNGNQVFPQRYQGRARFKLATFEEQIEFILQLNRSRQLNVGLYPEIKAPQWHHQQGKDIAALTLGILRQYGLDDLHSTVFLQCFDFNETKRLRKELDAKVKLVQLIGENSWLESSTDYDYLRTNEGLDEIKRIAHGIGPWIPQILKPSSDALDDLSTRALERGLLIHPYTFRKDQLPANMTEIELLEVLFKKHKVSGVFTDHTDVVADFLAR